MIQKIGDYDYEAVSPYTFCKKLDPDITVACYIVTKTYAIYEGGERRYEMVLLIENESGAFSEMVYTEEAREPLAVWLHLDWLFDHEPLEIAVEDNFILVRPQTVEEEDE